MVQNEGAAIARLGRRDAALIQFEFSRSAPPIAFEGARLMDLLTPALRTTLSANAMQRRVTLHRTHRAAQTAGMPEPDPVPVVKFFNPFGAATWLASELAADGDTVFGLADLGFGCPELGYLSLQEIASVRLPFGLSIERDLDFSSSYPLSIWTDIAHREGSIREAEILLGPP